MACGCSKTSKKTSSSSSAPVSNELLKLAPHGVNIAKEDLKSLPVLQVDIATARQRRNKCRYCEFSTKNTDKKYAINGGLTTHSICNKNDKKIVDITASSAEKCPISLW